MDFINEFVTKILSSKNSKLSENSFNSQNHIIEKKDLYNSKKNEHDFKKQIENEKEIIKNDDVKKNNLIKNYEHKWEETELKNERIVKELASYLWNNTDLDLSLKNMNNLEENAKNVWIEKNDWNEKTGNSVINFKKQTINFKWILFEFIAWILLMFVTISYVQTQPAEKKFLQSSISLWVNTFQKIVWSLWWVFSKNVDKNYIEKRWTLLSILIKDEKIVQDCLDKNINQEKRDNLQKVLLKIQWFKKELSNTEYITLDNFIQKYDQYNLYVYSLHKAVKETCGMN